MCPSISLWWPAWQQWCKQDFFQDQDQDQDPYFKTKTKSNVQFQDQHFASQDQDLFVIYIIEADRQGRFYVWVGGAQTSQLLASPPPNILFRTAKIRIVKI